MSLTTHHRAVIILLLAALVLPLAPRAAAAVTDGGAESVFVQLINQARARAGLPALSVAPDLVAVARRHSARMADSSDLHHNPSLAGEVSGWQKLGENVGRGPTVATIHDAFMNSSGHRANILSSDFTEVGVGVEVREGGRIWVTEVFRLPMQAASQPQPAPEPEAQPAPASAPQPASAPEPAPASQPAPQTADDASTADPEPATAVTAAAAEPATPLDDHSALMLAKVSARDLGVSVTEMLPSD